jgi:predicted ATP-dependent serine protease
LYEQIDPYLREFHPYKSLLEKPQNQATHYCETHDVKLKTAEELEAHDNCVILTDRQRSRRTNEGRRVSRRRLLTHVRALDEMLGSAEEPGYPPDDAVLIAGEPGCGKSTLCMWALSEMAHHGARVLYVSAEESAAQVLNRATTTGYYHRGMRIIGAKQIHEILPVCAAVRPHAIVIDSVSEMGVLGPYPKGGVRAVEAVANYAKGLATRYQALVMLVGHVTKANQIAGPKRLEHIVDATFQFSSSGARRDLYSEKNRFGPAKRTMHFEFRGPRLHACDDPTSNQLRDAIGRLGVVGFPFARNSDARLLPLENAVSAPRSKEDGGTRTVWAQGFPTPMLRELAARLDDVENGCFFARSLRARLATLTPETVTDAALLLGR